MKSWKRFLALALCLCMVMSVLAACGEEEPTEPATEPTTEATEAPTTEPATEPTTVPTTEAATEPATEPMYDGELVEYTFENGVLHLPAGLENTPVDGFDFVLGDATVAVMGVRDSAEEFSAAGLEFPADLAGYAAIVEENNGVPTPFSEDAYGNMYAEYTTEISGAEYYYFVVVVAGTDAFWSVNFCCLNSDADALVESFMLWASMMELN